MANPSDLDGVPKGLVANRGRRGGIKKPIQVVEGEGIPGPRQRQQQLQRNEDVLRSQGCGPDERV